MNPLVIPYPEIDPVLVHLGPLSIRWYALAYIVGLVIGWQIVRRLCERPPKVLSPLKIDDFLLWAALGVILGGRLGYVLFYKPLFYLANPLAIFTLWEGGMSFHGGMLGVIVAMLWYSYRRHIHPGRLWDFVAPLAPLGLFLGRIANFFNEELWGRPTNLPWAMVFRTDPQHLPRHPSQLYEAFLEGIMLFAILWTYSRKPRPPYAVGGLFLFFYGLFRFVVEFVREPDVQIGFAAFGWMSRGQELSLPMIIIGAALFIYAYRRRSPSA